jgi:hypothetical protein
VLGAEEFYGRHGFLIVGPGSTNKRGVSIPDTCGVSLAKRVELNVWDRALRARARMASGSAATKG